MPRRPIWTVAALAFAALAAVGDQSRCQPWFYQYAVMLAALAFSARSDAGLHTSRLIVAAIYFWSGLQKLNPNFRYDTLPWLLDPLGRVIPRFFRAHPDLIGIAAAAIESAIGIALLTRRWRTPAAAMAVLMHAFILVSIGPWGHNSNEVVWPWNFAMAASVVLLFWRAPEFAARDVLRGSRRPLHLAIVALFACAPALSFIGAWDHYLSFALYSGNPNTATIYMSDEAADRLPPELQEEIGVNPSGVDELSIADWSYDELHVPAYPELRVFRNIGRRVCELAGNPPQIVLVVQQKFSPFTRRRQSTYACAGLRE
jgi:uncharacterized membrane protein YphA (DoxX/SURF4 family)